jgi:hypothetical protein
MRQATTRTERFRPYPWLEEEVFICRWMVHLTDAEYLIHHDRIDPQSGHATEIRGGMQVEAERIIARGRNAMISYMCGGLDDYHINGVAREEGASQ